MQRIIIIKLRKENLWILMNCFWGNKILWNFRKRKPLLEKWWKIKLQAEGEWIKASLLIKRFCQLKKNNWNNVLDFYFCIFVWKALLHLRLTKESKLKEEQLINFLKIRSNINCKWKRKRIEFLFLLSKFFF